MITLGDLVQALAIKEKNLYHSGGTPQPDLSGRRAFSLSANGDAGGSKAQSEKSAK